MFLISFFHADKPVAISWPQRGDISFENVSLRYEGQTEDVIKNLSLNIPAGQRVSNKEIKKEINKLWKEFVQNKISCH